MNGFGVAFPACRNPFVFPPIFLKQKIGLGLHDLLNTGHQTEFFCLQLSPDSEIFVVIVLLSVFNITSIYGKVHFCNWWCNQ